MFRAFLKTLFAVVFMAGAVVGSCTTCAANHLIASSRKEP